MLYYRLIGLFGGQYAGILPPNLPVIGGFGGAFLQLFVANVKNLQPSNFGMIVVGTESRKLYSLEASYIRYWFANSVISPIKLCN